MQRVSIDKPSNDWDHVQFIAARLREFASSGPLDTDIHYGVKPKSGKRSTHIQRGIHAELLVWQVLSRRGWLNIAQRWRSRWGEVDGIFYGQGKILLMEVKAVPGDWSDLPVSNAQKRRLEAVFNQLLEKLPQYQLELWLAVVFSDHRIQFFTDYFGS